MGYRTKAPWSTVLVVFEKRKKQNECVIKGVDLNKWKLSMSKKEYNELRIRMEQHIRC